MARGPRRMSAGVSRARWTAVATALGLASLLALPLALRLAPAYALSPPPTASITTPASGGSYQYAQDVPTSFSCSDGAGPGLTSCVDSNGVAADPVGAVTAGALDTDELGTDLTYTVTATSSDTQTGTATVTYSVVQATQTVEFTTDAPNSAQVGGTPYLPNAVAIPSGLKVSITLDATSTGCAISPNNTVTFTAIGTCVIDAAQAGNADWAAATTLQQRISVTRGQAVITLTSFPPSPARPGGSFRASARSSSGDTVVVTLDAASKGCSIAAGTVRFSSAGTCVVDYNDPGNANYAGAAQVQLRIPVAKHPESVKVKAAPDSAAASTSIVVSATLSDAGATGSVVFKEKSVALCTATLHGGVASCKIAKKLGKGSYRVVAKYAGNANYDAASGSTTFKVT